MLAIYRRRPISSVEFNQFSPKGHGQKLDQEHHENMIRSYKRKTIMPVSEDVSNRVMLESRATMSISTAQELE